MCTKNTSRDSFCLLIKRQCCIIHIIYNCEVNIMKKTVISVMGKDTVGITARVSAACAEYNVNIIDITQSVLQDMFVMVMLTDISGLNCQFKDFSASMEKLGFDLNLEIHVMHEDIFNSMHRI